MRHTTDALASLWVDAYGDEGLADGGEDVGAERVQQQFVLSEDGEQQRAGVFRTQVLQQLQEARAAAHGHT